MSLLPKLLMLQRSSTFGYETGDQGQPAGLHLPAMLPMWRSAVHVQSRLHDYLVHTHNVGTVLLQYFRL